MIRSVLLALAAFVLILACAPGGERACATNQRACRDALNFLQKGMSGLQPYNKPLAFNSDSADGLRTSVVVLADVEFVTNQPPALGYIVLSLTKSDNTWQVDPSELRPFRPISLGRRWSLRATPYLVAGADCRVGRLGPNPTIRVKEQISECLDAHFAQNIVDQDVFIGDFWTASGQILEHVAFEVPRQKSPDYTFIATYVPNAPGDYAATAYLTDYEAYPDKLAFRVTP